MKIAFDPVVLEILWSRLLSVCDEQQLTLMRTAFSTVVRESPGPRLRRLRFPRLYDRPIA